MLHPRLPGFVQSFINDALNSATDICDHDLIAVYLFGGVAKGYFSQKVSDVDLLFIVSDDCSDENLNTLEDRLQNLERKYGILQTDSFDSLYLAFQTALFKSHYVLRLGSLRNMDYSAMFLEGRGLSFLKRNMKLLKSLSTSRLMFRNILKEATILFGEDVVKQLSVPPAISTDYVSVFMASWTISIFGLISSLFSRSSTRFSLEAVKYYIHNVYSLLNNKTTTINQSINYALSKHLLPKSFIIEKFVKLREAYSYDFLFCAVIPLYLLITHSRLTKYLRHIKLYDL